MGENLNEIVFGEDEDTSLFCHFSKPRCDGCWNFDEKIGLCKFALKLSRIPNSGIGIPGCD